MKTKNMAMALTFLLSSCSVSKNIPQELKIVHNIAKKTLNVINKTKKEPQSHNNTKSLFIGKFNHHYTASVLDIKNTPYLDKCSCREKLNFYSIAIDTENNFEITNTDFDIQKEIVTNKNILNMTIKKINECIKGMKEKIESKIYYEKGVKETLPLNN